MWSNSEGQLVSVGQQFIADSFIFLVPSMERCFGESWFRRQQISVGACVKDMQIWKQRDLHCIYCTYVRGLEL